MDKRTASSVAAKIKATGFTARVDESLHYRGSYGVLVSCEDGKDAGNYYDLSDPWINPTLKKIADDRGSYFEWVNPGELSIWD